MRCVSVTSLSSTSLGRMCAASRRTHAPLNAVGLWSEAATHATASRCGSQRVTGTARREDRCQADGVHSTSAVTVLQAATPCAGLGMCPTCAQHGVHTSRDAHPVPSAPTHSHTVPAQRGGPTSCVTHGPPMMSSASARMTYVGCVPARMSYGIVAFGRVWKRVGGVREQHSMRKRMGDPVGHTHPTGAPTRLRASAPAWTPD